MLATDNGLNKNKMELNIEKLNEAKQFLLNNGVSLNERIGFFRACELLEIYQKREIDRIRDEISDIPLNGITQYRVIKQMKKILK